MQKNKKGFMLVETLVVSTLVSTILIGLYVQFNALLKNFNRSFTYNSVNNLYATQNVKQLILDEPGFYDGLKTLLQNNTREADGTYFLEINTTCDINHKNTDADNAYVLANNCLLLNTLADFYKIKTIIFTYSYVGLNEDINPSDYDKLNSPNFTKFIKSIKGNTTPSIDDDTDIIYDYRVILEFENNEFTTLKLYN